MQENRIAPDVILSSRWCRCQDTAREMEMGPFTTHDGLNSFFDGHVDRAKTLAALREQMRAIEDGSLVLMVTHQVVITRSPASRHEAAAWSSITAALASGYPSPRLRSYHESELTPIAGLLA